MKYKTMETPVGTLLIAGDDAGLHFVGFGTGKKAAKPAPDWQESDCSVVNEAVCQLRAYFAKKLTTFELPLAPSGTPFQLAVWSELSRIPYGRVISYGELAKRVGRPHASRAVGAANGSNPIPIIVPCHRVIGANGRLTGYGGGLPVKEALLELERGDTAVCRRLEFDAVW